MKMKKKHKNDCTVRTSSFRLHAAYCCRVLTRAKTAEHITSVLRHLHWLPVSLIIVNCFNGFINRANILYISDLVLHHEALKTQVCLEPVRQNFPELNQNMLS